MLIELLDRLDKNFWPTLWYLSILGVWLIMNISMLASVLMTILNDHKMHYAKRLYDLNVKIMSETDIKPKE